MEGWGGGIFEAFKILCVGSPESTDKGHLNWTVSIPLCTCNNFIKLNRLYTAYK